MKNPNASKAEFTEMYSRLPLGPGVPSLSLTGFDFAPIESRKPVEKDLKEFMTFCRRDATSFNVKVIRAEWGEGKTDAYERYIRPQAEKKGDACYFVSTSTLVDKIEIFESIFPTPKYVASSKFLASLFVAIVDEAFHQGMNLTIFPDPSAFQKDPYRFIEEALKKHLDKGFKRIFVFIDEFEELLIHEADIQRQIISGIKELVNGQLGLIHEGGKYSGMLHFFIACTPYAYNRIMDSIELAQMTGSVKSRFTSITLPEIGKLEALRFLFDLIRFSYENKLPGNFPFRTTGPLNGIYTISHGNLREMIKLFVKLMSTAADEKQKRLRIIDYEHFLDSLGDEEIAIYGATGKAIDSELLGKIIANMNTWKRGEECKKVLSLLIGELRPFSINEIAKRLRIPPNDVHELIANINSELKKMGIEKTITALMPLSEDKTFETVKNRLNISENQIIIGENQTPLKKFEEKLTFYEIHKDGTISGFIFLPKEVRDLQLMFEELSEDEAENLYNRINELFDQVGARRHYILSQEFANQIFPSPIWLLMDFVKDRTKRMDLWRKASKEFVESVKEFKEGVIHLIEHTGLGKFEHASERSPKFYKFYYNVPPDKKLEIHSYIHVSTGNISSQDINEISKDIRAQRPNLIILIYTGEIEDALPSTIDGIENVFLQLHFRKLRALQLIVAQLAKQEKIADDRVLDARLREISDEAEIREKLEECYGKCKSAGIVIDDLFTHYAESGAMLAGILKYYINFLGSKKTSSEVFAEYEKNLKRIKFFGDKEAPFAPIDIDSVGEFAKYEEELAKNGFITRRSDSTVVVEQTSIEKRLIATMKRYPKIPLSQLKKFFINAAQAENILERVYLPLLEYKGLIKIEGDEILAINLEERKHQLESSFENYKISLQSEPPTWRSFAKICVTKGGKEERDMAIIDLDFFNQLLHKTITEIEEEQEESLLCQKIHLATLILDYYKQKLKPRIDLAYTAALELSKKCKEDVEEVKSKLEKVLNAYNDYCIDKKYSYEDIEEFSKLNGALEKFNKTFEATFTLEELQNTYKEFSWKEFHFRESDLAKAHFFNLKYAKLEKIYNELSSMAGASTHDSSEVERDLQDIEGLRVQIQREISRYSIPSDYSVSSKIIDFLQEYQLKPMQAQSALPKIKINVIKEFFKSLDKKLNRDQTKVQQILSKVEFLKKSEKRLYETTVKKLFEMASEFFAGYYGNEFKIIKEDIDAAFGNYESLKSLVNTQTIGSLDDLFNIVESAEKRFKEIIDVKLSDAEIRLGSVFEDANGKLLTIEHEIRDFISVLKKGIGESVCNLCDKYSEEIKTEIMITMGAIKTIEKGEKTAYIWNDRLKQLNVLRDKFFKDLGPVLPSKQGNIMLEIVRLSQEKGTKWIDMDTLVSELEKRLGLDKEEIIPSLKELAKINLLKEGASLPI